MQVFEEEAKEMGVSLDDGVFDWNFISVLIQNYGTFYEKILSKSFDKERLFFRHQIMVKDNGMLVFADLSQTKI